MESETGFAKENPWVKWFFDDWLNDEDLQPCSFAAQGLWMSLLGLMRRGRPYGFLQDKRGLWTVERIAGRLDKPVAEVQSLFEELERNNVFSRNDDGVPFCRRLVRDFLKSTHRAQAGTRGAEVRYGETYVKSYGNDQDMVAMANAIAKPLTNGLANSRARAYDSDSVSVSNNSKSSKNIEEQKTLESNNSHSQVGNDLRSIETPTNSHGNHAVSKESLVLAKPGVSELGIEGWDELVELGSSVAMVMDPDPGSDLCQKFWRRQSFEGRLERIKALRDKIACGQFSDPQYVPSLENFVRTKYRESHRPKAKAVDRGQALIARIRAEEAEKTAKKSATSVPIRGDPESDRGGGYEMRSAVRTG